ncbi:MAG: hypothetical protein JWR90_3415 [Marmoricola sp.]|jgi:hypothetical protein|nr:hypothetical protein [Marmoricola sp.]
MQSEDPLRQAGAVLHRLVYGSVDWPGKSLRLDADSLDRFLQRPLSGAVSLSELYHENSKLIAERAAERLCQDLDVLPFKLSIVQAVSRAATAAAPTRAIQVPDELTDILDRYPAGLPAELHYAVEVRPLVDNHVMVHEPLTNRCRALRTLSSAELERLESGVYAASATAPSGRRRLMFVIGLFARNAILYGERGYRSTLLESGVVLHAIATAAAGLGVATHVITEFQDHCVDSILDVDGTEAGTLAVVSLGKDSR